MNILNRIQNHLIKRIILYSWQYKSIRDFNTSYLIHECYEPNYLIVSGNDLLIGNNGHEVHANNLDLFKLKDLLRFVIKTQRNKD